MRPVLIPSFADDPPMKVLWQDRHQEGGQRTISRFLWIPAGDDGWYSQVFRHWNSDRADPRGRPTCHDRDRRQRSQHGVSTTEPMSPRVRSQTPCIRR